MQWKCDQVFILLTKIVILQLPNHPFKPLSRQRRVQASLKFSTQITLTERFPCADPREVSVASLDNLQSRTAIAADSCNPLKLPARAHVMDSRFLSQLHLAGDSSQNLSDRLVNGIDRIGKIQYLPLPSYGRLQISPLAIRVHSYYINQQAKLLRVMTITRKSLHGVMALLLPLPELVDTVCLRFLRSFGKCLPHLLPSLQPPFMLLQGTLAQTILRQPEKRDANLG